MLYSADNNLFFLFYQVVYHSFSSVSPVLPSLVFYPSDIVSELRSSNCFLYNLFKFREIFLIKPVPDFRYYLESPDRSVKPGCVIRGFVFRRSCTDNRSLEYKGVIKGNCREVGNQNIRRSQDVEVIIVSVPVQMFRIRILFLQWFQNILFMILRSRRS